MREVEIRAESWPIARRFAISRGSKTEARVVVVEIREGEAKGRGECVPYARYGETVAGVIEAVRAVEADLERGLPREPLRKRLPAGAARNAIDCALWDLEAKRRGKPVWQLAGLPEPGPALSAYTIGLDRPSAMAAAARGVRDRPLLKLKLDAATPVECVAAVREAVPSARLIVDANEAWSPAQLRSLVRPLVELGVELIEQPLPAGRDAALAEIESPVPVCADESCHDAATLERLVGLYDCVNIKLDKTGGLTEALEVTEAARDLGFGIMVGCMVGTSLAMAPAVLLAGVAWFVDLDGPLLLERDREPGIRYGGSVLSPPPRELWG